MNKTIYSCDICNTENKVDNLLDVTIPRRIYYRDAGVVQTIVLKQKVCQHCCKKIAKLIDEM